VADAVVGFAPVVSVIIPDSRPGDTVDRIKGGTLADVGIQYLRLVA
jgi:hypothetical protein